MNGLEVRRRRQRLSSSNPLKPPHGYTYIRWVGVRWQRRREMRQALGNLGNHGLCGGGER